jgi:ArsR family metal-binding transcriptional regulator
VDENFEQLMHQLGEAINDAVMTSTDVDTALDKVRTSGIDVFLVLEATICVRRRDGESLDVKVQRALPSADE